MNEAIIGFVGVVVGAVATLSGEWLKERRSRHRQATYLAVRISCELDRFIEGCGAVATDDGLCEGQTSPEGYLEPQTHEPQFAPLSIDGDWRALRTDLMYEVLDFPSRVEQAEGMVRAAADQGGPPWDELIEERQYQYALLGLEARKLATKIRAKCRVPARVYAGWDPYASLGECGREG